MEHKKTEAKTKETTRIEAFSDGVFGIAITLLVLELIQALHNLPEGKLQMIFTDHWEIFLAFTIGFVTILVCWINHHVAFEYIRKVDTRLMWINGFLLFIITLTPFPTAILAEYLEKEGRTALAIFGVNYVLISIAADAICTYAYNHYLVETEHRDYYRSYKRIYRYAIFFNLLALAASFVSVVIPIILYTLLFVFFAAPREMSSWLFRIRARKKNE